MNIICKQWIELPELPDSEKSGMSYIKLQDIERIYFVEKSSHEIIIFVSALGKEFFCNSVETMEEAVLSSKGLIKDIENSKQK